MSVSTATRSASLIRPIAIPATGALIGTPASIRAIEPAHTVAIEEDPLDSRMSLTMRIVYGKRVSAGIMGSIERSASAPWPISRRPGPRIGRTSPTLKGGKL
jgi:hypothetical protein